MSHNTCVGLAGNNIELSGNGKPELQAIALDLSGNVKEQADITNMSVMHVLVNHLIYIISSSIT